MPPKRTDVGPSQTLLQRIFGQEPFSSEILEAIEIAKQENPNLAPTESYGSFSKLLLPQAGAYASPGRKIYLNPQRLSGQDPQFIADILLHEQKHIDQMKETGLGPTAGFIKEMFSGKEPYHRRPDEREAYQLEVERRNRMGRPQMPIPSFNTGKPFIPRDIELD